MAHQICKQLAFLMSLVHQNWVSMFPILSVSFMQHLSDLSRAELAVGGQVSSPQRFCQNFCLIFQTSLADTPEQLRHGQRNPEAHNILAVWHYKKPQRSVKSCKHFFGLQFLLCNADLQLAS